MIRKSIFITFLSLVFNISCIYTPFSYGGNLETQKGIYHKVERGQTLWRIAKVYNVPVDELMRVNKIEDVTNIKVGQQIFIPGATEKLKVDMSIPPQRLSLAKNSTSKENSFSNHEFSSKHELFSKYESPSTQNLSSNHSNHEFFSKKATSTPLFIWPVEGEVISEFGPRGNSMHNGIDIKAKLDTPIRAARDGIVTYSGNAFRGYGNTIIITHEDDFTTVYAHNSLNLVKENQRVKQGEIIGKVGQTGNATTPHLHFEVWKEFTAQNPRWYLP